MPNRRKPTARRCKAFCETRGLPAPKSHEKHHRVCIGTTMLRWEQHSEFTTYTWELPADAGAAPFHPAASSLASPMSLLPQPGPLLAAIDLHLVAEAKERIAPERVFDRASLAVAENSDGTALYATDFKLDPAGFVRILVVDRGLGPERAGALVQRLLELETYRSFALLGLPEAQKLGALDQPHRKAAGGSHRRRCGRRSISPTTGICSMN